MIHNELLNLLVCPEKKCPLHLADDALIQAVNQRIADGAMKNRAGEAVSEPIAQGLVREGNDFLYPVRDDIPVMLIDEALPLAGLI